jgi:hypothetical protein
VPRQFSDGERLPRCPTLADDRAHGGGVIAIPPRQHDERFLGAVLGVAPVTLAVEPLPEEAHRLRPVAIEEAREDTLGGIAPAA